MKVQTNLIIDLTMEFSLNAIVKVKQVKAIGEYELSRQFFKSATSVGANVREAQHAESRPDFIHKMKLAAKEAEESLYWIEIMKRGFDVPGLDELEGQAIVIQKVLSKIIGTTRKQL